MGRKSWIAVVALVVLIGGAVGAAYAYDNSRKDEIAHGITIGGVDVGGLTAEQAERKLERRLLQPLRKPIKVRFEGESWKLSGKKLKVEADLAASVEEAIEQSREGGLPARLVRYVSGEGVEDSIEPKLTYSEKAIKRFVKHVAEEIEQEPQNATVEANSDGLTIVPGKEGRKLRDNLLTEEIQEAVLSGSADRSIRAHVKSTKPEITKDELAEQYPTYLTLNRSTYTLRLWKNLKLAKTYTVAVGMAGLETPEGLYEIQSKEENPVWHVPESDWAGDLAGQVIPPGPSNPIKARWMGIYEGAGIHGTDDIGSLGSAASHGCIRMAIPEVEELYDQVEIGTPIYIG